MLDPMQSMNHLKKNSGLGMVLGGLAGVGLYISFVKFKKPMSQIPRNVKE